MVSAVIISQGKRETGRVLLVDLYQLYRLYQIYHLYHLYLINYRLYYSQHIKIRAGTESAEMNTWQALRIAMQLSSSQPYKY